MNSKGASDPVKGGTKGTKQCVVDTPPHVLVDSTESVPTPCLLRGVLAHSVYTPCILHVYSVYTPCVLHAHSVYTPCILHVYSVEAPWTPWRLHGLTWSLHVYSMYTPCGLHVDSMWTPYLGGLAWNKA